MQTRFGQPRVPLSQAESRALAALECLPATYQVQLNPPGIDLKKWNVGTSGTYEPDFAVISPSGERLVVEVKSVSSLSLANMVRFVEIDRQVRESGGRFVLLAWGSDEPRSRTKDLPEFKELHIHFVSSDGEVVRAIEAELSEPVSKA
jgi:hypothetical protein